VIANDPNQTAESERWFGRLLTFRDTASQGKYFLGLLVEFGILFIGAMALAALNNPAGAGGGVVFFAFFPFLAFYLHLCLVIARMRDVGVAYPVILGIFVAILPFLWFGLTLEFIERLWPVVLIGFLAFYVGPALLKPKAAETTQS
jgi:uncharacterized membrane protein YhaH (DUF805 family)